MHSTGVQIYSTVKLCHDLLHLYKENDKISVQMKRLIFIFIVAVAFFLQTP